MNYDYDNWKHPIFFLIIAITLGKHALFHMVMSYLWWAIPLLDSTMRVKKAKAALWTEWPARANPVHSTISPKKFAPDTYSNMPPTNRKYLCRDIWSEDTTQTICFQSNKKLFQTCFKAENWHHMSLIKSDQHIVFFMSEKSMTDSSCQSSLIHQIKENKPLDSNNFDIGFILLNNLNRLE